MRELKTHEIEQVGGGFGISSERPSCSLPSQKISNESMFLALRAGLEIDERDTQMPISRFGFSGFNQGSPLGTIERLPNNHSRPPRTLGARPVITGTIRGPFTFKTPYLNR